MFSRGPPATLAFNSTLDLEMNTSGNVIPLYTKNIHASIYLADTEKLIAEGDTGGFWRRPGAAEPLGINMLFSYLTDNSSDATCAFGLLRGSGTVLDAQLIHTPVSCG